MKNITPFPLIGGLCFALAAAPAISAQQAVIGPEGKIPPRVALLRLIPDEPLRRPVHLAELPGGQGELVVVQQAGLIKRFQPSGKKAEGILLDIRDRVSDWGNEEGLLSVAFHPRFAANRYLYVYYSAQPLSGQRRTVVARFTYDPVRRTADPATEYILMQVSQPYSNHKGGQLAFGPDGFLYIGLGDGGSAGDPHGNGQNPNQLLGKLLRIDVDHLAYGHNYGIPFDNPYFGAGDGHARSGLPEIYALGLRNPWRFSFDRESGLLYVGDVGQDTIEEVDIVTRGGNYGWNVLEGTHCFNPERECPRAGFTFPIAEYGHNEGISVIGGFVYRGRALPGLEGRYLFGDYGSGTIWTIPAGAQIPGENPRSRTVLLQSSLSLSSFGEDSSGELYLVDLRGGVYRLVPAS